MSVEWAFTTLKSIRSDHLRQALIYPPQRTPDDRENCIIFKDVTGAHANGETRLAPGPILGNKQQQWTWPGIPGSVIDEKYRGPG